MPLAFREITLSDKPWIDAYFKPLQIGNSEFTFTYLMMWGLGGKIQVAEQEDVLYIRLQFKPNYPFFFPPIPKKLDQKMDYQRMLSVVLDHVASKGKKPIFHCVVGPFRQLFRRHCKNYVLKTDRNSYDYIYLAENLIHLKGRRYHSKRNHINQVLSNYQVEYRPLTEDMFLECMDVYEKWLDEKDLEQPGIQNERDAIRFLIPNMDALGVTGGAIYNQANNQLLAFTLGEQIREDMALIHVEKADPQISGLYAVINQQFAANEWEHVNYINREEDMGLEGLRRAKQSYHPVTLLEKCMAKPR